MPTSPPLLTEIATRSQLYLERYKTGVFNKYEPFLKDMAKMLRVRLLEKDITDLTRFRFEKLLKGINQDLSKIQTDYIFYEFTPSSLALAEQQASFEVKSLEQVAMHDFVIPTEAQLKSAILTNPMGASGANGKLLMSFIKDLSKPAIDDITNAIRAGAYEGKTTQQIIRQLTSASGELARLGTTTDKIVHTGLQHVSSQARNETWKNNDDIIAGFKVVVTFDNKTSKICRGYGSTPDKVYKVSEDPMPPFHIFCRSTTQAALDSRFDFLKEDATRSARDENGKVISVPADESYYDWLKRQDDPAFQDSILGKTRGKLFREGGISTQRFAELQLNKKSLPLETIIRDGKKITPIMQMKELEPLAFGRAGLD